MLNNYSIHSLIFRTHQKDNKDRATQEIKRVVFYLKSSPDRVAMQDAR